MQHIQNAALVQEADKNAEESYNKSVVLVLKNLKEQLNSTLKHKHYKEKLKEKLRSEARSILKNRKNLTEKIKHEKVESARTRSKKIIEEQDRADAHPYGLRPFKRQNYINKFLILTENILDKKESNRFLKTVQNLEKLKSGQLDKLNIDVRKSKIKRNLKKGIF